MWSEQRPGESPGRFDPEGCLSSIQLPSGGAGSWLVAGTAERDPSGVAGAVPGVAFLSRQHAVGRDGEARRHILGQRAQLRELAEAPVVWEAVPLLKQRQRPLQQQLVYELRVAGRTGEPDRRRAAAGCA